MIDSLNQRLYERPRVVQRYGREAELFPQEIRILHDYDRFIRNAAVLDIGCGGGRTTSSLVEPARDYMGIDYSERMVASCRERYPGLRFEHCDASNMGIFADGSFGFVLFSFNGIDCMSHAKRLATLREVFRVLSPGGIFAFSAHNLDDAGRMPVFNAADLKRPRGVLRNLRNLASYLLVCRHEVRADAYAVLSDPLAGFGHLTYYIRKADQVRQLEDAGFLDVAVLDHEAAYAGVDQPDRRSPWLYYVCRKPA